MKKFYLCVFLFISYNFVFGQLGFESIGFYTGSLSEGLCLADISGNGKPDVIYSRNTSIRMIKNNSPSSNTIYNVLLLKSASSLLSADLDGDNDLDIISANFLDDNISWYENNYTNINGPAYFSNVQKNITNTVNGPVSIFAEDVDNDGDIDILAASTYDYTVAWYENLDGLGNFGTKNVIFNLNVAPHYVGCADFNNDGLKDVLIATTNDDKLRWYINNGQGNFVLQQTITSIADGSYDAHLADIDGDGDIDIVGASIIDNKIAWYENTNGLGNFGGQQIISTNVFLAKKVYGGDLDNDGDQDVLAIGNNELVWFENIDGLGTFGTKQILISDIVRSIFIEDFDEDGLLDIVYNKSNDQLGWLKNLGILKNEINGKVRLDVNNNGCDNNDISLSNLIVTTTNGTESLSTISLNNGFYQLFPDEGNFITTITSPLPNYFNVSPNSNNSAFVGYGSTDTDNFCLQASSNVNDLSVSFYPIFEDPRPGSNITYQLIYRNNGSTQQTGTIELGFDGNKISFVNVNASVVQNSNNILSFNYSNLNPFEIRVINVTFYVNPFLVNLGDILSFTATAYPLIGDITVEDNVFVLDDIVVNSYDPNDIRVLEGDEVNINNYDKYLHYIIRFQNTGTANAIDVNIENILDTNLDWTTLQIESFSHDARVEITNGNQVKYIFDDINLPDSTNDEPNSHGYISYKIKPINSVQVGDIINNEADIFFDYNQAIITNTVSTEFVNLLSTLDFDLNTTLIFPNPTFGQVNIVSKSLVNKIKLIDIQGRELKEFQFENPKLNTKIDLSFLASGVYFLNIKQNEKYENFKIIVN